MDDLLPYYERELGIFRQYTRQFSERFPKTAGKLLIAGENSEDPHVERMIQSFALLTARVSKRLDSDYPKFTEAMLESLYPHFLRPLPSYSIVEIGGRDNEQPESIAVLPRGSTLQSDSVQGVTCLFTTAYDVTLAPLVIPKVTFMPVIDDTLRAMRLPPTVTASISITIDSIAHGLGAFAARLKKIRVFIDAEPSLRASLIDTLLIRSAGAYLQDGSTGAWNALKRVPLDVAGFGDDDTMIPFTARSHPAFRLLTEYFSYPEKFNFIDIDLSEIAPLLSEKCSRMTLQFTIAGLSSDSNEARLLAALSNKNFKLSCTPVVNLFEKRGIPVQQDHTSADYPLLADATHASGYEIHSVNSVRLVRESSAGNTVTDFTPLYAARPDGAADGKGNYWMARRDETIAAISPGHELRITLVDSDFNPSSGETATLSTELSCTNRDLPSQLRYGHVSGDLTCDAVATTMPIRLLRKPSSPYRFASDKGSHWRLISHLTLNYSTLTNAGLSDLRKMLSLYDLPRSAISQRQIGGIVGLEHGTVRAWMPTLPVASLMPGIGIRMTVDEQAFVGSALYIFARVMDRYFALNRQLNCFTQLEIVSEQSGKEILRCQPRCAEKA
ncbi:type VI secretion system baseplate subunit TssF [Massilia soli]|uniref:Type VI secretion system baseplate subunit TssF n=1 Tax=Massilia soli TaxID=2792854 RepID=A0ABS7SW02_9BURK|nr:type VI secretion system baseplate subunit TssF [Massilia soli]